MIVDDEYIICDGLMSFDWEKYGYTAVCSASDGEEALSLMKTHDIDVVLTDIKMPVMNGLDLCMHVNRIYPKCKVVILSGHRDFEYAKAAISLGVCEYLLKPVDMRELSGLLIRLKENLDKEKVNLIEQKDFTPVNTNCTVIKDNGKTGARYSLAIQNTIKYIRLHYSEKLTLHDIAENVYLSEGYLCAQFSKEVGKSFLEFLNEVRIEEAKALLKKAELKVYQIAEKVGYVNTKYFTDVFKKYTGLTPLKFKEE